MGQARHALVAQHGEGGGADRGLLVDGNADEHVARHLRVEADARDLAHGHPLVAHGGLGLQAAHAVLGGQLVLLVVGAVAREPDGQARQHGGHHQHEDACGEGVGFVFHQLGSLSGVGTAAAVCAARACSTDCTGAMARWPRSPRKKCSMNGCLKCATSCGGPVTMTFLSASTATRVLSANSVSRSCVTMTTVSPSAARSSRSSAQKSSELLGSSPAVGSSSSSSGGSMMSARASATRLTMPPDRSAGMRVACSG